MFRRQSGLEMAATTLESLLGLVAVFMIGYAAPVALLFTTLVLLINGAQLKDPSVLLGGLVAFLGMCATMGSALWTGKLASHAADRCLPGWLVRPGSPARGRPWAVPVAVVMARRMPRIPLLLALPLSAWWLAHFAAGIFCHIGLTHFGKLAVQNGVQWGPIVLLATAVFAMTFAANVYALMAVSLLVRDRSLVYALWQWRFLFDAAVVAISFRIV